MATGVRERQVPKQSESVRLDSEALTKARVAAAYTKKTVGEYISDLILAHADRDIEEGHDRMKGLKAGGKSSKRPKPE